MAKNKIPVRPMPKDKKCLIFPSVNAVCIEFGGFKKPCPVPCMVLIVDSPDKGLFGLKLMEYREGKMWQYCTTGWYFKNRRQARYWQKKEAARMRKNNMYVIESFLRDTLPAYNMERADTYPQQAAVSPLETAHGAA